jgi:hypothetical protein
MINETVDKNAKDFLEIRDIPLCANIVLQQTLVGNAKKTYTVNQKLVIGTIEVTDSLDIDRIKILFQRFSRYQLNSTHINDHIEYVTKKNEEGEIVRSLRIKHTKIYIAETEVDTAIWRWNKALVGYNEIRVYDQYVFFTLNGDLNRSGLKDNQIPSVYKQKDFPESYKLINQLIQEPLTDEIIRYVEQKKEDALKESVRDRSFSIG